MVLENKLNITNQIELNRFEEKISKEKAKKLFDSGKSLKIFMILPENCVILIFLKEISDLLRLCI